jgi:GTP cyclohydrolase I
MPDIANEARPAVAGALDWVGMGEIELPVRFLDAAGASHASGARVNAFVNLMRPEVRGIHMSRLYLHVDRALGEEPLSPCSLRRLLKAFLDSHADLSDRAMVQLHFDYLVRRPALVSENTGWKSYPVSVTAVLDRGQFSLELGVQASYSSTCPCSAALARQLIQENFANQFADGQPIDRETVLRWLGSEQGINATPHSQRSTAEVRAKLAPSFQNLPFIEIINRIESALKTPPGACRKPWTKTSGSATSGFAPRISKACTLTTR